MCFNTGPGGYHRSCFGYVEFFTIKLHALTKLFFTDGSMTTVHALSELYILQEAAGRWADNMGLDLAGEEVRLGDMFDIIGGTGMGG